MGRRSRNHREGDIEKLINKMKRPASPPPRIGKDDLLARARHEVDLWNKESELVEFVKKNKDLKEELKIYQKVFAIDYGFGERATMDLIARIYLRNVLDLGPNEEHREKMAICLAELKERVKTRKEEEEKKKEEERMRKEEEEKRKEEERMRKEEEEKRKEEEEKKKEEERMRKEEMEKRKEEETIRKEEEEKRKEVERVRKEEERMRKEEKKRKKEERMRKEEEEKRKEEERMRKGEEEKRKQEERMRKEEEEKGKEEERMRKEEEEKRKEEERMRKEEEEKRKEEERMRKEEEEKRKEEERMRTEEEKKRKEEERMRKEEEEKRKEEKRIKGEEEIRKQKNQMKKVLVELKIVIQRKREDTDFFVPRGVFLFSIDIMKEIPKDSTTKEQQFQSLRIPKEVSESDNGAVDKSDMKHVSDEGPVDETGRQERPIRRNWSQRILRFFRRCF